ncbi:MAG: putative DNA-binding domain-containing protein [Myxococcaceae bacterium]
MKLADFYSTIAPYLEGRAAYAPTLEALYGKSPARDSHRIAIYERFCRSHRQTATGGVHQYVKELIIAQAGKDRWDALVEAYFVAHPMQHVEINENGAHLAQFLGDQPNAPKLWSQLADFEWWEWQTLVAPDRPEDAPGGPLRMASTVELRPYAWDFPAWIDEAERAGEPEAIDVLVLFWRDAELQPRRALATMDELRVLKAVSEGAAVERDATVDDLLGAGILLGEPRPPSPPRR